MLYDILIIDNDFGQESDSDEYSDNANTLLCLLLRDRLRVTWTTGEITDLPRFKESDLSQIKFIFLDLRLEGINEADHFKTVNSKIMGIFRKLDPLIKSEKVICYINSKRNLSNYGKKGLADLKKKLTDLSENKYSLEQVETKNDLNDEQKKELYTTTAQIYAKSLIINKHIEIENVLDEILEIPRKIRTILTSYQRKKLMNNKDFWNLLKTESGNLTPECKNSIKNQLELLNKLRNKLAHTDGDLHKIKDSTMRKTFRKLIGEEDNSKPINFPDIDTLMDYLVSVDALCTKLKK